jgi:hypothetical protein
MPVAPETLDQHVGHRWVLGLRCVLQPDLTGNRR